MKPEVINALPWGTVSISLLARRAEKRPGATLYRGSFQP
jgi:hypothetical protein